MKRLPTMRLKEVASSSISSPVWISTLRVRSPLLIWEAAAARSLRCRVKYRDREIPASTPISTSARARPMAVEIAESLKSATIR